MQFMYRILGTLCAVVLSTQSATAQYDAWAHQGSFYIITTPDGANLPETARETDFPILVRLHRDWFDFRQAQTRGNDIRFSSATGQPLRFQIEHWDAAKGSASIWVRIPLIEGNRRQEIRMHWGRTDAESESNGAAVFSDSNGFISVWHLNDTVHDEVGTLESTDTGTTRTGGIIGGARHFPGGKGVFCGQEITGLPTGDSVHSTQAWFRSEKSRGRVVAWGNEEGQGKVVMQYRSPHRVWMECYFSDANVGAPIAASRSEWVHAVHTYRRGQSQIYVNGVLAGRGNPRATPLNVRRPARLWIGGWYNNYNFEGDIDELRISNVVRSADWIKLEYENQKPLQTLVGPIVQGGSQFGVSRRAVVVSEGQQLKLVGTANGAQKVYWNVKRNQHTSLVAVDRLHFTLHAGRVSGDQSLTIQFQAVYPDEIKTFETSVVIREQIPEPKFTLQAPRTWDGRQTIELEPQVQNMSELRAAGVGKLDYRWDISGLATIHENTNGKLVLQRAQNSGQLHVTAHLANGGQEVLSRVQIAVQEPDTDAWVQRPPASDERPLDNQFYARDDSNRGTLHAKGTLKSPADSVFLNVSADGKPFASKKQAVKSDGTYALAVHLKPGLIKYTATIGTIQNGVSQVLHRAQNIVCGDAYIIEGQSNALATDTRDQSPAVTHEWIRSYGNPRGNEADTDQNLWCHPVWKARQGEKAELGYWGMELAKRLVQSHQVPICIINGAVGGTRIDQHQRNPEDPTDLSTIYGRLLWRVRRARLTHGIRAVLWHQGENDQGAAGPDGGYGWETYQQYFVRMSAAWKQDYPNLRKYYVFQIWPNACAMGRGHGDMLREVQRTLPRLYSNLEIMSTLGISPPGGCHYPLEGWAQFAKLIQPLIERDFYGVAATNPITPANLKRIRYTSDLRNEIRIEFDQPIEWQETLADQFHLDRFRARQSKIHVASGRVSGNVLTLKLSGTSSAEVITYLKETSWNPKQILRGRNGIAALTFCNVPIDAP